METEIFTCKYFKFGRNTTGLSQSHLRNFLACSIKLIRHFSVSYLESFQNCMGTCKNDLINHFQFQESLSLYIINKLHHGKCFCTIFTHSFVFTKLTRSQSLARSF